MPSDLLGVGHLHYQPRTDGNCRAAVQAAMGDLRPFILANPCVDKPVRYWHSITNRHRDGVDARSLIGNAERRIFVSGITLSFICRYCKQELSTAMTRGASVFLVVAPNT